MHKLSNLLFITLLSVFIISSCKQKPEVKQEQAATTTAEVQSPQAEPGFVHAVYFWLKKDNPELVKEFIEVGLPELAKVPSIQSVSWGPPAGTPREVVDNSYDLAWIVNFANAEDQDKYQVDPLHVEFVEKYKSIFDRVQVYDNIVNHHVAQ